MENFAFNPTCTVEGPKISKAMFVFFSSMTHKITNIQTDRQTHTLLELIFGGNLRLWTQN